MPTTLANLKGQSSYIVGTQAAGSGPGTITDSVQQPYDRVFSGGSITNTDPADQALLLYFQDQLTNTQVRVGLAIPAAADDTHPTVVGLADALPDYFLNGYVLNAATDFRVDALGTTTTGFVEIAILGQAV